MVNLDIPSVMRYSDYSLGDSARTVAYDYPMNKDIKPGSALHERIRYDVMTRAEHSYGVMQRRHADWNKIDRNLTAYVPLDDYEKTLKAYDERKPVSVVVPYSYATLETLLTYMVSVNLNMPIFHFESLIGGANKVGTIMLETLIAQHCLFNKVGLALHTMYRDGFVYGCGAVSPTWTERWGFRTTMEQGYKERIEAKLFEGNALQNIDPYLYLPDPNVPIDRPQDGEFVGWVRRTNFMTLMEEEGTYDDIFNVQYLKEKDARSFLFRNDDSGRQTRYGGDTRGGVLTSVLVRPADEVNMYMKIIPADWGLGPESYPCKYLFSVVGDTIVTRAQPLGLDHDMYPVGVFVPDYDGYSTTPLSKMELIFGLQGILDFLMTSHVTNIRKAINDMLIVDPFLINMKDLEDPQPGKLIKMRRAAWGRGVENAVKQLAVTDVTRNHMADASMVIDFMQRGSGCVDSVMGIMRGGSERRSATESRDTRMSALSRLAKTARVCSLMTHSDIAYMFAKNTQQLMEMETYLSTLGQYQQELEDEYGIGPSGNPLIASPAALWNLEYQVSVHDGTLEAGEFADTWTQLWQILSTQPAVGSGFDMVRIFKHIARMTGAKNVNDFVRKGGSMQIKTMQDQQVQAEAQKGNLVPVPNGEAGAM